MPTESLNIVDQVRKLRTASGLSTGELSRRAGMPESSLRKLLKENSRRRPSQASLEKLRSLLAVPAGFCPKEAEQRAARLAELLCRVQDELAWFKDSPQDARRVYRSALDQFDAGYVASLMTMMFDEDQLRRWQAVGTVRFNRFRKKGGRT